MRSIYFSALIAMLTSCLGEEDAEPVCERGSAACNLRSYVALCEPPTTNEAVETNGGLYCIQGDLTDSQFDYIGPDVEAAQCTNGQPSCPNGEEPACYYLAGCPGDIF